MATKKPAGKSVVPRKSNLPTHSAPPGRGFEDADADAYAIPFLAILQKLTPQADPDDAAYVKGAKPGMFMNTVTLELFEEVELIPCAYQRRFNRWAPRDSGGGFKGSFTKSQVDEFEASGVIKQNEEGRWFFADAAGEVNEKKCDILTDTRMHFCQMVMEDGSLQGVLVSLSRTQLKKSRTWMTNMQQKGGDMWTQAYKATTKLEENDKGKWSGWVIVPSRPTEEEERAACEAFYTSVQAGGVKVKMERDED